MEVMVPADSPIQSAADLKGKKVEINPWWVAPFRVVHGLTFVKQELQAHGLDPTKDVTLMPMPWEALPKLNDYVAEGFKTGVISFGFDREVDLAQSLERSFKERIDMGLIKTDKTPQQLVRLHYRRIE
jgi:ABC-type nitrate/sulfonate/bicarbonate transport system substrate-binding protein